MMMIKRILFSAFILTGLGVMHAQDAISIARYLGNRQAAVSYTFDDGLIDHYTLVRPEMNRRGMRGTFAIIGSKVGGIMHSSHDKKNGSTGTPCMTWDMLRQLAHEGHEVSSHGWGHQNVTKLNREALRYEVQHNDTAIYEHTGHFPRTYFYPGNRKSDEVLAFCGRDRVGTRTYQVDIGSRRSAEWLNQWADTIVAQGYDHFPDPQTLWSHWDYVVTLQDRLWVAPFCEVAAYVSERDSVQIEVNVDKKNVIAITPRCPLDSRIFNQPLTLLLPDARIRRASQDGHRLKVYRHRGRQLLDFNPHGGTIVVKTR